MPHMPSGTYLSCHDHGNWKKESKMHSADLEFDRPVICPKMLWLVVLLSGKWEDSIPKRHS